MLLSLTLLTSLLLRRLLLLLLTLPAAGVAAVVVVIVDTVAAAAAAAVHLHIADVCVFVLYACACKRRACSKAIIALRARFY